MRPVLKSNARQLILIPDDAALLWRQYEKFVISAAVSLIVSKSSFRGIAANDAEVAYAVRYAFKELKLVVEPGGAIGLAALLAGRLDVKGKVVVGVLSGANVDPEVFANLIAG